ncbi:MAG: hypothetical protein WD823_03615 [Sulfuricaulis sp.]|uniref:hypothetical protein n=1 Tax=Sulfuricaulis sp. TaxID=2003553 RepID=UPI0034A2C3C3
MAAPRRQLSDVSSEPGGSRDQEQPCPDDDGADGARDALTGRRETLPVLAAILISAVATLIIVFWLPDTDPCLLRADPEGVNVRKVLGQDHKACFRLTGAHKLSFADIMALPSVGLLLALYFLVFLTFNLF